MELDDDDSDRNEALQARARLGAEEEQALMHALSARLPAIAWAMFTAGLRKHEMTSVDFTDVVAELTQDAARLAGGTGGFLMLFGKLAEAGGALIDELAEALGVDPAALAQQRGNELAERVERFRTSAQAMRLDWPE